MPSRQVRVPAVGRFLTPVGQQFVSVEALSGVVVLVGALGALVWANVAPGSYDDVWSRTAALGPESWHLSLDLRHWINDALMALFFFVVGLEIKRELVTGELRNPRTALVPVVAAAGGMVVPAALFAALNAGTASADGWGIPIATDIALALGLLALLGRSVPAPLRLFLLTLAIVDDIGAIVVIAVFYSGDVEPGWIVAAAAVGAAAVAMRHLRIAMPAAYALPAVVLWYAVHRSGVHATIAGVALGLLTPATNVGGRAVLTDLERKLHPVSSFAVVPVFALANAGVVLDGSALREAATSRLGWGIAAGLLAGKLFGIAGATWLALRTGLGRLPADLRFAHVAAGGLVGGIGFTVSLFVADLSFTGDTLERAKVAVLVASALAGGLGALSIRVLARRASR
jgi:NhaA family Na+:H+ antiporter